MNLYRRLEHLAQYQPDKIAVESIRASLSYLQLDLLARRIAARLRAATIGRGDIVGLYLRDTPEHVAAWFAVARLGAIALPVDWRAPRLELERLLRQFGPKVVLEDTGSSVDLSCPCMAMAEVNTAAPDTGAIEALTQATLLYSLTSGTTGNPAALIVTHENIHARMAARVIEGILAPDERFLSVLPLAYTAGREHAMNQILLGGTVILFPSMFEPSELVAAVNTRGISSLTLSPNSTRALLALQSEEPNCEAVLMPGLRTLVSTTGKLLPDERAAIRSRLAARVIDYYGSTGTGPIAVIREAADGTDPVAVGRAVIGMDVEIVDTSGSVLPSAAVGRIRVRGPAVSANFGAVDSGLNSFRDGWYYPGDLGHMSPEGILHLDDRESDLIKRGGQMVYTQEVEQVLRRYPGVVDAAVVGAPSDSLGQEVVAFVVAHGALDLKAVIRHCRLELAAFKVPARVEMRA
jgi:acyl-CoA synthetase (AMP-forming)/AMP-acid ligase II